jgi:hypothetical protein
MRATIAILCLSLSGWSVQAAPPSLKIDAEIEAKGEYVSFKPVTDAKTVLYIGMSGLEPLPSDLFRDSTTFIVCVRGVKPDTYRFVAIAFANNEYTRQDFVIRVPGKVDPVPDPKPVDPPKPDPKPDPKLDDANVETNGLHVVFVYESGKGLSQDQFNILYSAQTAKYLNENCDRTKGQPNWRIIDQNNKPLSEPWKSVLERKRTSVPWVVVISDKKYVYEGELKDTPDEFIKRLDQYKPKQRTDHCPDCPAPYRFQQTPLK